MSSLPNLLIQFLTFIDNSMVTLSSLSWWQLTILGVLLLVAIGCLSLAWGNWKEIHTYRHKKHQRHIESAGRTLEKIQAFPSNLARMNYLRKIHPSTFEELLLTAFSKKGFIAKRNDRYTGDGGIDGTLFFKGEKFLVQAKRYKMDSYVSMAHVREFVAICQKKRCHGFFCHTGKTPQEAWSVIQGTRVKIIHGEALCELLCNPKASIMQ
jgi:restriction system protein